MGTQIILRRVGDQVIRMTTCIFCRSEYPFTRKDRQFCSIKCQRDHRYASKDERAMQCLICKTPFSKSKLQRKFCSEKCRTESFNEYRNTQYRDTHPLLSKSCAQCTKPFIVKAGIPKFCSKRCYNLSLKERYQDKHITSTFLKCMNCMSEYIPNFQSGRKAGFCSTDCKKEYSKKYFKEYRNRPGARDRKHLSAKTIRRKLTVVLTRKCMVCESSYGRDRHPQAKTCSDKCSKIYRKEHRVDRATSNLRKVLTQIDELDERMKSNLGFFCEETT
jgi:predicted nucleic acid-binding Zn ribbon protein